MPNGRLLIISVNVHLAWVWADKTRDSWRKRRIWDIQAMVTSWRRRDIQTRFHHVVVAVFTQIVIFLLALSPSIMSPPQMVQKTMSINIEIIDNVEKHPIKAT
jgi:hypothetical protein